MHFTRRNFIKLGGVAIVATLGTSAPALAAPSGDVLSAQTADTFRQLVGSDFYVGAGGFSSVARLVEVREFPKTLKRGECFSLHFETDAENAEQSIYEVFHPSIGNFDLLMTAGKNGKSTFLVATVNRI